MNATARAPSPVFVNCPFDQAYRPFMWAVVFAIVDAGFEPRSALSLDDAGTTRLERIVSLVQGCQLSIHDLCRADTPRFNMPFEVGLALGFARADRASERRALIVTTSRKKFDRACSDLRGVDPQIYRGAEGRVRVVTAWLH